MTVMNLEHTVEGSALVVKPLTKRFDAAVVPSFKDQLSEQINAGFKCIILDLSVVDFMDSTALGAIISALKTLGSQGNLMVCEPNARIENLFRVTRMNRVFPIFSRKREAIQAIAASP